MKRHHIAFFSATTALAIALANPSWALAAASYESCIATTKASYGCVNFTGYTGYDSYGFYTHASTAADGTRHNCTSYVAYRLFYSNQYMPALSGFGDARFWASQAVTFVGATLNKVPQVGDIAWWDATATNSSGHVAVVDSVTQSSSGAVTMVKVSDDNYGRRITTVKTFYPGNSGSVTYPDTFIRFPGYISNGFGGAGGKPSYPLGSTLEATNDLGQ